MYKGPTVDSQRLRAQSEVLGYIIVFSIVLVAIGVVSAFGVTALDEVKEATVTDNGEIAMQSLDANLDALYYGETTARETELSLDSASLETGQVVNVEVETASSGVIASGSLRPIIYKSDDASIVYENSMVVREQQGGAVGLTTPLFRRYIDSTTSTDRVSVPVVETTSPSVRSVSGGTRRIVARRLSADDSAAVAGSPVDATFRMVWSSSTPPERTSVWVAVLNEELQSPSNSEPCEILTGAPGPRVECDIEPNTLVVSVVEIEYELE